METMIRLPDCWDGWEITEPIGSGSYGTVYKAVHHDPHSSEVSPAAVKVIRIPTSSAEAAILEHEIPDKEARIRYCESIVDGLRSEIHAMEMLRDNTHIVALQDYFIDYNGDLPEWTIYIRMELLTPLPDHLIANIPEESWSIRLGIELCEALEACEEKGILHRDIKPENIMVNGDGSFLLGDFGVAKQMDLTTASLSMKGTFTYMAPEVYHGEAYNSKADQYSLGMVLYRLLNHNRDPFLDPSSRMVYFKDREEALRRRMSGESLPAPAEASERTAAVIKKACAFSPEDRYERIADLKHDLLILSGEMPESQLIAGNENNAETDVPSAINAPKTKKRRKLLLPVGIAAAVLVLLIAMFAPGLFSGIVESGTCGNSLKWELNRDGTLTISGSGMMNSYELLHPSPWRYEDYSEAEVKEGVTGIGSYAFRMATLMENIMLPASLEYIGDGAFSNCWILPSVTLGEKVSYVGEGVFDSCINLRTITVDPENPVYDSRDYCNAVIETATNTLVAGCPVTVIPEGVSAIGPGAFYSLPNLTEINIPDSCEYIDDTAFENCPEELVIYGSSGSAAEDYAKAHNLEFREA